MAIDDFNRQQEDDRNLGGPGRDSNPLLAEEMDTGGSSGTSGDFSISAEEEYLAQEPVNFEFTLVWSSNPSGINYTVNNNGLTKTKWSTKEVLNKKTFLAKAGGYGESTDIYSVVASEIEGRFGIPTYNVLVRKNGVVVKTITPSDKYFTGTFTFKKEESVKEQEPPKGISVSVDLQMPDGVSALIQVANSGVTTVRGTETTSNVTDSEAESGNLSVGLSGTDSTCNYLYELVNSNGALISTGTTKSFSQNNLKTGAYKLKIVVSKTEKPKLPDPTPSYRYRTETYYEPSTRTVGNAARAAKTVTTQASSDRTFVNFGSGAEGDTTLEIDFSSTNADYVNFTLGKNTTKLNRSGTVTLGGGDLFQGEGKYTAFFQAVSNLDGTGNIVPIQFTAIKKTLLPGPDIITINYPQEIIGKDYQGYNVDFEISWTSINTNYVDIYINEVIDSKKLASTRPADGTQSFNIGQVLRKAGDTLNEDVDVAVFDLKLIPYNAEGDSKTAGKTETIQIKFDKGNIKLRRDEVLRDIKESICDLFDTNILGGDSSKYLTHLMHFGDADNKVIASWDTDYETFSEYEFREDTGERIKIHEEKTLVFKLYEPLPREVQPNQQIWVSKIQSIPYVEQITIINEEVEDCIELVPNFGSGICSTGQNIGYQLYDDLISSGSSSSTKLLTEFVSGSGFDLKKLDIQFVSSSKVESGSLLIEGDSIWAWNNFVKYSSAEERVNNFMYKIKLMEFYQDKITKLESGSFHTGSVTLQNEINRNSQSIQEVKDNFDAFETFLFTSSSADGLTYPGAGGTQVSASDSSDAQNWYGSISSNANNYDYYNKDYLINNLPLHVQNSEDSEQFKMFFNMMGHHFDVLYSYTKAIAQKKNLEHKYNIGIKDSLVAEMLKSLSWDTKVPARAQSLWEYAFGETADGTSVSSMTGKEMQNQIWRRLLNNLPYLLKHKGSSRAVKAALACYGVPSSMLTIMEFGGPRKADGGTTKFSFEDRTAAINISGSQSILVPWKQYSETSDYPNCVEIRVNSNTRQDQTFVTSSLWSVGVEHINGTNAVLKLTVSDPTGSYSVTSSQFPFYNDEYTQIIVTRNTNSFNVYGKEAFQGRIRSEVSASLELENHIWQTDTILKIGDGSTFTGSVDEFRYWTVPLSESRMDNHTLMPDAIDGNHHSSSTEDLILRLDFEYPKDRSSSGDTSIKNVSINETYDVDFVTASNFDSITEYPYHYTTYERTVTANVPSSGFGIGNKFRFESQQSINPTEDIDGTGLTLSYRERSTKKSLDTAPIDSNRLGLFFSPIKEINMDMLKSLGQFELDDYIGDPNDRYSDEYRDLRLLRNYYFERYSINLYEYIQLVRYIDQSLFETLESLVPARAIVSSGLLIEPHLLERNKVKHRPPTAEDVLARIRQPKIDLKDTVKIRPENIKRHDKTLKPFDGLRWGVDGKQIRDGRLRNFGPNLRYERQNYNGIIRSVGPTYIASLDLIDGRITDTLAIQRLLRQFEANGGQSQVGVDPRNLRNGLAGIYAQNGIANITRLDGNGQLIKERKQVWIVEEQYTEKVKQAIAGTGQKTADGKRWLKEPLYELVEVTKTRKIVMFNDIGDNPPSGPNILSAVAANSNGGKLPGGNLGEKYGKRGFRSPALQTSRTTLDGRSPVETFCTNPNILKVSDTARGKGEPILEVDRK